MSHSEHFVDALRLGTWWLGLVLRKGDSVALEPQLIVSDPSISDDFGRSRGCLNAVLCYAEGDSTVEQRREGDATTCRKTAAITD
jgi:hypothetical protein